MIAPFKQLVNKVDEKNKRKAGFRYSIPECLYLHTLRKEPRMTRRRVCLTLFLSMLRISAFTFGGGFVIIPLMRKQFVEKLKWLEEDDMLDMIAIAQSSPGAVSVNIASQLGYRISGAAGSACAVAGAVLPPLVWLSLISMCYESFRSSPVVDAFLRSMQPAVAAVILSASLSMLHSLKHKERLSTWALLAGAIALSSLGVKAILILLFGGVFGVLITLREVKKHAR